MRRTAFLVTVVVVAVALGAAACGSSEPDVSSGSSSSTPPGSGATTPGAGSAPASTGSTPASLDGTTYTSTAVTGHELVAGSQITMAFADGSVSVNAGCNTIRGSYAVEGDTLVVAEDMASTMMACENDLTEQDTWLTAWLASGPTLATTADGISLSGDGVTIDLAEDAGGPGGTSATGTPVLTGTTWTMHTIISGDTASSVPAGVEPPTLVFGDDGSVAVFTGCNQGSTTAVAGGDGFLTFEPMMTTMMSCGPDADAVAATVTTVLDGRVAYGWEGAGDLSLANGGQTLVFAAG